MANGKMGNGASVVMLSKVIKFKLIDGWRHPFFPHLFRLTFASGVVPLSYVNESERERESEIGALRCLSELQKVWPIRVHNLRVIDSFASNYRLHKILKYRLHFYLYFNYLVLK